MAVVESRNYSNTSVPTSLSDDIDEAAESIPVVSTSGFPAPPFLVALNRATPNEEVVLVGGMDATNFLDCVRGYDDTEARAASSGDPAVAVVAAIDYREANEHHRSVRSDHTPAGVGMPWFGLEGSLPTGWLLCAGQAVSRSTYADLFAVIGITYGAGDGNTTFNLPDLRGRALVGQDDMGGTPANRITGSWADTLGGTGGVEEVTLSEAQMPVHTHVQSAHSHSASPHTHTASGSAESAGEHRHGFYYARYTGQDHNQANQTDAFVMRNARQGGFYGVLDSKQWLVNWAPTPDPNMIKLAGTHTHAVSITLGSASISLSTTTATNSNAGSGQAHTNLQPSMAVNWIIKAYDGAPTV